MLQQHYYVRQHVHLSNWLRLEHVFDRPVLRAKRQLVLSKQFTAASAVAFNHYNSVRQFELL